MSFARRVKRNVEKTDQADEPTFIPPNHAMLPTGQIMSDPVRGEHLALPLFGWVCKRVKEGTPLVMVTSVLIGLDQDPKPKGTIQIEYPVYPETERAVYGELEILGWDGRVWPDEPGWPDEDPPSKEHIEALLKQARLTSTLIFPPYSSGFCAKTVNVTRARGPFLMPPLPDYEGEPDPIKLEKLRKLCADPSFLLVKP